MLVVGLVVPTGQVVQACVPSADLYVPELHAEQMSGALAVTMPEIEFLVSATPTTIWPTVTVYSCSAPQSCESASASVPMNCRFRPCDVLSTMLHPRYVCQDAVNGLYFTDKMNSFSFKVKELGVPPWVGA